jgi:chaperonin GroES
MKQVDPLENRILVRPTDPTTITAGGIHLPDNAREKQNEGTVTHVGPGKRGDDGELIPVTVKPGDVVIYSKYAGTELQIEGQDHVLLRDSDCLATISEVPAKAPAEATV